MGNVASRKGSCGSKDQQLSKPQADAACSGQDDAGKSCPVVLHSGDPAEVPNQGAAIADAVVELKADEVKSYEEFIQKSMASNEAHRLAVLTELNLRAAPPRPELVTITELLKSFFDVQLALVGIVEDENLNLYAYAGTWGGSPDLPRDFTICQYLTLSKDFKPLIIEDVDGDVRSRKCPYVQEDPYIRFYAAAPLLSSFDRSSYGTLCIIDYKRRTFLPEMYAVLINFAEIAVRELERDKMLSLRQRALESHLSAKTLMLRAMDAVDDPMLVFDLSHRDWPLVYANSASAAMVGCSPGLDYATDGPSFWELFDLEPGHDVDSAKLARAAAEVAAAELTPFTLRAVVRHGAAGVGREALTLEMKPSHGAHLMGGVLNCRSSDSSVRSSSRSSGYTAGEQNGDGLELGVPVVAEDEMSLSQFDELDPAAQARSVASRALASVAAAPPTGLYFCVPVRDDSRAAAAPPRAAFAHEQVDAIAASVQAALGLEDLCGAGDGMPGGDQESAVGTVIGGGVVKSGFPGENMPATASDDATPEAANALSTPSSNVAAQAAALPAVLFGMRPALMDEVRLGCLIGVGSSGRTYRGLWHGGRVAVKVVECWAPAECSPFDRQRSADERAARDAHAAVVEAALGRALAHPHLVPTYAYAVRATPPDAQGLVHTATWIVQEFCARGSLINAVERGELGTPGKPNVRAILATAGEVAGAMAYLHSCGVLHADLSGNNVLLSSSPSDSRRWVAMVADFGMARIKGTPGLHSAPHGTVTHMSPEYLRGGPMTPEVDVWSFGCLLWEMCAGRHAYDALTYHQVLHAVTTEEHVLPARGLPGVPAGLEEVMASCLALDPSARPSFEQLSKTIPALARELKRQATPARE